MSTFTSNFAPQIEAMLEWRTSLGHTLRDMRNAMAGFTYDFDASLGS